MLMNTKLAEYLQSMKVDCYSSDLHGERMRKWEAARTSRQKEQFLSLDYVGEYVSWVSNK